MSAYFATTLLNLAALNVSSCGILGSLMETKHEWDTMSDSWYVSSILAFCSVQFDVLCGVTSVVEDLHALRMRRLPPTELLSLSYRPYAEPSSSNPYSLRHKL